MTKIKRSISPLGLLMASISAIIGSGWLFSAFYTSRIAGPAALISWLIGGLCLIIVAFVFAEICTLTTVQEGTIVRCITRLDEVCREVRNASRIIGDPQLYRKMEVGSECIKRDIVFATSLYIS